MKSIFCSIVFVLLNLTHFVLCAQQRPGLSQETVRYFDETNMEISEEKYMEQLGSRDYLEVPGDSSNYKRLVYRYAEGNLVHIEKVYKTLDSLSIYSLNFDKPIVCIYYPGRDKCNSSGTKSNSKKDVLRNELEKIDEQINLVRIYKDDTGLNLKKKKQEWIQDPGLFFEKNFFNYHYPCGSFVVIAPSGKYFAYLGEYPLVYILESTRLLLENS